MTKDYKEITKIQQKTTHIILHTHTKVPEKVHGNEIKDMSGEGI